MAKIDEMVLSMDFDNSRFKQGATETLSVLDRLKKNLNFDSLKNVFKGASDGVSDLQKQVSSVDLNSIGSQLENMTSQWSIWGTVGRTAVARITNSVMDLGGKLKGMVWDPIVSGGMNRARNLEQANFMLQGIIGDVADAEQQIKGIMGDANEAVQGTAFGLDSAAKAAAQFAATGMRGGDQMIGTLRGIAGVASMTSSEYDDIASIFTTISGQGRLMTMQLNQLAGRGINAAATLAEHFGVTEGALREMVTAGEVSFEDFAAAMDTAFGEQSQRANETYTGSLSNLRSALGRIGADVAGAQLENMRNLFNALRPAVNAVHGALEPFITLIIDRMGRGFNLVIGPIEKFTSSLESFNKTGAASTPAWTGFFRFMQDLGVIIGLVADVFADAIKVILGGTPRFIEMSSTMSESGTKIYHIFRKLLSVVMLVPEIIGLILKEVFGLAGGMGSLGGSILDVVGHFASWAYLTAENIRSSKVLQVVIKGIGTVAKIALGGFALLGRGVVKVFDLLNMLIEFLSPMTSVVAEFAGKVGDFFLSIMDFKLPKLNLREFTSFNGVIKSTVQWFKDLGRAILDLDFSFITDLFSGFGSIGEWFSNFEMPEFSMEGLNNARRSISDFARTGFNNLKMGGNLDFAFRIRDMGVSALDFVKSIDYRAVYEGVKNGLVNAFEMAVTGLTNLSKWIGNAIGKIDWASVGDTIGNGFIKAFTFITGTAGAIVAFLTDFFGNIFEQIDWEGILEGLANFKDNIEGAFSEIGQAFRGETIDTSYLENALGSATADVAINVTQDLGSKTQGIRDTIKDFFGALFGTGGDIDPEASEVLSGVKSFGDSVKTVGDKLSSPFATAKAAVTTEVSGFGATLKDTATAMLEGVNLVEILNGIGLAFTGAGLFKVAESIEKIAAVPEALTGALTSLGTAFTSIGEAAKIEAQGNAVLKVAVSLAVLVGAIWLLSKIPWESAAIGLGVVAALLAALVGSMVILDKVLSEDAGKKLSSLATSMMLMGVAVGILAASVWLLGKMDIGTVLQGLGVALLSITMLAGGVALAGMAKNVAGIGLAFLGLALGVGILAASLLVFKFINYEEIEKGLLTIAAILITLSVAARIADGKKLAGAGVAMLGVGAGLLALSYGIKSIANLDAGQILKGLGVLAAVMVGLTLMTKFGGGKLTATIGALVGLSFALIALSYAIGLIANIDFWDAAGGMAVLVVGLIGLGLAMRAFPKTMPAIAGSLVAIAGALAILIAAIWLIGNMDLSTVAQGVIVLGGALGGLFAVLKFLPPSAVASMIPLAAGMLALSASMLILAVAMRALNDVEWSSLGKAALILVGLGAAIALMAVFGAAAAPGLLALGGGLAALGGGLLVIAAAVWVFADAVSGLIDSLVELGKNGENVKNALKEVGEGITIFAEEAEEGLERLFDIFSNAGVLDVGKLATFFGAFKDIPTDAGPRLESLVEGLLVLEDAFPIMEELNAFGAQVGFGDNRSIGGFFRAFDSVNADSGAEIKGFVEGILHLEKALPLMQSINDFGAQVGFGDNRSIGGFFGAFDSINANSGPELESFADGVMKLQPVIPIMYEMKGFAEANSGGDNRSLTGFFEAFEGLDSGTGDNMSSVANSLIEFGKAIPVMYEIKGFGEFLDRGDSKSLTQFFEAFEGLDSGMGDNMSSVANSIREFGKALPVMYEIKGFGEDIDGGSIKSISNFFHSLSGSISADLGSTLSAASDGIQEFGESVPVLTEAIGQLEGLNVESLTEIVSNIEQAFSSGVGDGLSQAADAIRTAVEGMLTAATDRTGEFKTAGEGLGDGLVGGVESKEKPAGDAGKSLGEAAARSARGTRSRMVSAGEYIGQGLARGIRNSTADAVAAARDMANAVAEASRVELDTRSPSRVFMEIGKYVSQGFALGITADGPKASAAIVDTMDAAIRTMNGKTFDLKDSTKGFYDGLINQFNNNPMTRRLEELSKHSQAAYATAVKERRIRDELDREQAEDDKEKAYRDVEDAQRGVEDARKALHEAKQQELSESRTAEEHARDISDKKRAIEDAEKKHRRSVAARERYEYQMHGEEAGVAFVDGVAEGIIDNSDQLPSVAEILSAVLLEELDYVKAQANDFIGVFEGLSGVRNSFKSIRDEARDLHRALGRLSTVSSSRAYERNMDMIIDSTLKIAQEFIGLMDVFDRFAPYLPSLLDQFDSVLPAIIPMVAQFAPGLASTLGGGLAAAIPAIAGPVGGIIAAIAGIGIFLYDMANDQLILGLVKRIFNGFIQFIRELPEKLPRLIRMLIRGFVNLIKELPYLISDLAVAFVEAFVEIIVMLPEIIPDIIEALIDAFIEIVTFLPVALVEASGAIVKALLEGFGKIVVGLIFGVPKMFFRVGVALVEGLIRGVTSLGGSMFSAVGSVFSGIIGVAKSLFGINSPSRVFNTIGQAIMEGLQGGVSSKAKRAQDTIRDAIDKILKDLDDGPDGTITITPVIDTSEVEKGFGELSRSLSGSTLTAGSSHNDVASIEAIRSEEEVLGNAPVQHVTNIEYTQNNTSPRPLSAIEIYRNTQKQLELMR